MAESLTIDGIADQVSVVIPSETTWRRGMATLQGIGRAADLLSSAS